MTTARRAPRWTAAVLAAALVALNAAPALAQMQVPPAVEAVARDAFGRLRSPVTPSHTLDMCPAEAAVALRDSIRVQVLGGMTADQVVESVIARHGEQVRLLPKRSGFGLAAWLLTPLALVAGGAFLVLRLRAMRHSGPAPLVAGAAALTPEERGRLDAALRDFDREDEA